MSNDDLARRAVACKGWRWMPRMVDTNGYTFIEHADCGEAQWLWVAEDGCESLPVEGRLPDLSDPATLGCLLALVREAWATPTRCLWYDSEMTSQGSWCWDDGKGGFWMGDTEAEALVAALEALPPLI